MNNEPVAWMETYKGEPNNLDWDKSNLNYGDEFHDVVPLYTHPAKELHLSLQKSKETGELLAVTYTDDEHRIVEVLWKKPPAKTLTDDEIKQLQRECIADVYAQAHFHGDKYINSQQAILNFARAILRKAQEK